MGRWDPQRRMQMLAFSSSVTAWWESDMPCIYLRSGHSW